MPKAVCLRSRGAAVLRGGYIMPWCRRDRFEAAPSPKRTFPMFLTAFTAAIKAGKASPAASGWGWPSQRKWRKSWAGRFRLPVRRKQAPCFRSSSACKKERARYFTQAKSPRTAAAQRPGDFALPEAGGHSKKKPPDGKSGGGMPDAIRTHDLQSRSLTLYPTELRAHIQLTYYIGYFLVLQGETEKTKKYSKFRKKDVDISPAR